MTEACDCQQDTPHPVSGGGIPLPQPNPLPDWPIGPHPIPDRPIEPRPIPDWPPDFFRCLRARGISGRYGGFQGGGPFVVSRRLDLRIDVDLRHNSNSPVMNRVSGDHFRRGLVFVPGRPLRFSETYVESWIVDNPVVRWQRCRAIITGDVRYYRGVHPATTVRIEVPWSWGAIGDAVVTFTTAGVAGAPYTCGYVSDAFRSLELEVDYATSVDIAPDAPAYDTTWHANRPADTPARTLSIAEAFRETGVEVTMSGGRNQIDDSAAGFTSWSPAELHDAMETAYSRYGSTWPDWRMWGLQAGRFDNPSVGGIMFDAAAAYGGAGRAPERQGFAVFRNHSWFTDLVAGTPANQEQARAMRHYLYTWVHEAGHAFNLLHSWDKGRASSLSWMNYDWKYDAINGADQFWANFRFRFDDEELIHIRHADRAAVVMGGDPWASGGHLENPGAAYLEPGPEQPVELLVRAKRYYEFLEPVEVELRLRNLSTVPTVIDARLDPRYGSTTVVIGKPDGTTVQFGSVMCLLGQAEVRTLSPAPSGDDAPGPDRYSEKVPLSYGSDGFLFEQPGTYRIRAVYSAGDAFAVSPVTVIRVGQPAGLEEDRFAGDFFTPQVGLTMALGGSMSEHLGAGLDTLREAADRLADRAVGPKAAQVVAASIGDDFYRRTETGDGDAMVKVHGADPAAALALTAPARQALHSEGDKTDNLAYRELVEFRADLHAANGDPDLAANELTALGDDLARRGANPDVVADVQAHAAAVKPKR